MMVTKEIFLKHSIGTIFLCKITKEWILVKITDNQVFSEIINSKNNFSNDKIDDIINVFQLIDWLDPKEYNFDEDMKKLLT